MTEMTAEECRTEALKRVQRCDELFAQYQQVEPYGDSRPLYDEVCQLRQTAAVYAALASDG